MSSSGGLVYNEWMRVTGVLAPVPTPFDEQDHVDLVRLRAAFVRWVASPLSGFASSARTARRR